MPRIRSFGVIDPAFIHYANELLGEHAWRDGVDALDLPSTSLNSFEI